MQIVSDGQNLNNKLTKRPSVRQSRLFRERESGNTMKNLLGQSHLNWDVTRTQGAWDNPVFDHNKPHGYDEQQQNNNNRGQNYRPIARQNINKNNNNIKAKKTKIIRVGKRNNNINTYTNNNTNNTNIKQPQQSQHQPQIVKLNRKIEYEVNSQRSKSHQSLLETRPW